MTRVNLGRLLLLSCCVALAARSAVAHAQDTAAPADAPADAPAGADAAAGEGAVEVEPAPDAALAEAMERFTDANAMFERGDFRGALAEMQRVYELLEGHENQHFVLYNLGRVYEELHRYDLAVATFQRYLDESPADAEDRADAEASLRALERLLGVVSIEVDVEHAEVWIGEWQVGEAPGEIRVPSGVHVLELRAEGHETVRRQIEITARARLELNETLPVLNDFRGLDPALFVTSTVLAVVAAGVGASLGGVALTMSQDAAACGTRRGCMLEDEAGQRRQISDFALGADILFGTAGLFAVTSVILIFVTDWGGRPEAGAGAAPAASAFRLLPHAGPDGGGLVLDARF